MRAGSAGGGLVADQAQGRSGGVRVAGHGLEPVGEGAESAHHARQDRQGRGGGHGGKRDDHGSVRRGGIPVAEPVFGAGGFLPGGEQGLLDTAQVVEGEGVRPLGDDLLGGGGDAQRAEERGQIRPDMEEERGFAVVILGEIVLF